MQQKTLQRWVFRQSQQRCAYVPKRTIQKDISNTLGPLAPRGTISKSEPVHLPTVFKSDTPSITIKSESSSIVSLPGTLSTDVLIKQESAPAETESAPNTPSDSTLSYYFRSTRC